jgi:signal transduction histidine kinase
MLLQSRLKEYPHRPAIRVMKEYGDLPPVECYAGQLNQVFMNILVNAIDAIEEKIQSGASSTVKHGLEEIPCKEIAASALQSNQAEPPENEIPRGIITIRTAITQNQQVTIQISDNGPGMSESVQQRLLDPFFTTKPVGKGTGLGLSISYQIIEKHHGTLQCISAIGQGTLFVITIPLRQRRATTHADADQTDRLYQFELKSC